MKKFSFQERQKNLKYFETQELDLFIVGGGINGAGVARDASLRGMKVGMIEARDFASGTSSRSSKLIHGGIRYLENMEFKLVFEALNERTKLFEMAPHLVHHLRFMIPIYKTSRVSLWKMGMGMWLYDLLALFQAPEIHEKLSADQAMMRMPSLREKDLMGACVYSDAYMDDARLVYETLRSANENNALCANYVKAIGADFDKDQKITRVLCQDELTQRKFYVRAKHYVSCVGPWTDQLAQSFDPKWKTILRPTKGIHLTLSRDRLKMENAVVMGAEKSDRIVFGIPRHEMILIGTTDTDYKGSPEDVSVLPEDVDYLMQIVDSYFPGAKIKPQDILSSYAGVRPLVQDQSASEGKTSREHSIFNDMHGVTYIAGGKYTTYRLIAQEVVEYILKHSSIDERVKFKSVNTARPLNEFTGAEECDAALTGYDKWKRSPALSLPELHSLVERYGLEAEKMLNEYPDMNGLEIEAAQAIEHSMCLNLVDFYSRRVPVFLSMKDHGLQTLDSVGAVFKYYLGWSDEKTESEKENYRKYVEQELAWQKATR
ncbi:MAG: glycerol-3-phosphate dehydrogenase/oxidase [Bdellovibrionota bacterium]